MKQEGPVQRPMTLEELIEKRDVTEKEALSLQEELPKIKYTVDFDKLSNIKAVMRQIDKNYTWTIKNAALVINLYNSLNEYRVEFTKNEPESFEIELNSIDLNTLYKVLTTMEGTGVESAKTFTRLLTNLGKQITDAMNLLKESNEKVANVHTELAELEATIEQMKKEEAAEEVTAEVEE